MNKTTEALKLAEEALSFYVEDFDCAADVIAIAAIREALAEPVKQEPVELQEVKRVVEEGGGFWRECSGCYESNEGAPPNGAVFSKAFDCYLGNGCSECGGLGAIWDNTDYEEMARFMAAQDAAPVQPVKQEPVAFRTMELRMKPVAYGVKNTDEFLIFQNEQQAQHYADKWELVVVPLYAAPKQEKQEPEPVAWINEYELPEHYPYEEMFNASTIIDGVRMFPNVKMSARSMFYGLTKDHTWLSVTESQFNKLKPEKRMKCYLTPVDAKAIRAEALEEAAKVCEEGTALTYFQNTDCYNYAHNRAKAIRSLK